MNAFFLLKGKESRPIPRLAIKIARRHLAGVSAARHTRSGEEQKHSPPERAGKFETRHFSMLLGMGWERGGRGCQIFNNLDKFKDKHMRGTRE